MGFTKERIARALKISCKRLNNSQNSSLKKGRKPISPIIKSQVQDFYHAHSRPLPLKQRNGEKDVRILEDNLRHLYKNFTSETQVKISSTKFVLLRQRNIKTASTKSFLICLCEVCLNLKLKIEALLRNGIKLPAYFMSLHDLINKTVCDTQSKTCYFVKCKECGVSLLKDDFQSGSLDGEQFVK